jgi:hypothetical protein
MYTKPSALDRLVVVARWFARLTSAAFALGYLVLLVVGLRDVVTGRTGNTYPWAITFLALAVVAAILAWRWEGLGGALLTAVGLYAVLIEVSQGFMDAGPVLPFVLGSIFVACSAYSFRPLQFEYPADRSNDESGEWRTNLSGAQSANLVVTTSR